MKFLEGVDCSIVEGLRKTGAGVWYVVEQAPSTDDEVILERARTENRILITRDKDFGELVYRLHKAHTGVILLRLEGYDTNERAVLVCTLIEKHNKRLQNSFSVIQRGIIRIR